MKIKICDNEGILDLEKSYRFLNEYGLIKFFDSKEFDQTPVISFELRTEYIPSKDEISNRFIQVSLRDFLFDTPKHTRSSVERYLILSNKNIITERNDVRFTDKLIATNIKPLPQSLKHKLLELSNFTTQGELFDNFTKELKDIARLYLSDVYSHLKRLNELGKIKFVKYNNFEINGIVLFRFIVDFKTSVDDISYVFLLLKNSGTGDRYILKIAKVHFVLTNTCSIKEDVDLEVVNVTNSSYSRKTIINSEKFSKFLDNINYY